MSGGFKLIGEMLEDREAKFRLRGKNWTTDSDVWIGDVQVLGCYSTLLWKLTVKLTSIYGYSFQIEGNHW